MISPSRTATTPVAADADGFRAKTDRAVLARVSARITLCLLSAGLMTCSLPKPDLGSLAWIALVPLMIACHGVSLRQGAGLGFVSGFAAAFGIYNWLFEVPGFGWTQAPILAIYVSLYCVVWCAGLALFNRANAPFLLTAPALWVAVDYARAHAGFLALPWGTLAQTQHANLALLQFASVAGEHGVTFLVVLGNAAIAVIIVQRAWRGPILAATVLALAHGWGVWELYSQMPEANYKIAAIQPNIQIKERASPAARQDSLKRLEALTRTAAAANPALIVWPESAIPGNLQSNPQTQTRLQSLFREIGIPIILGVAEVEKFIVADGVKPQRPKAYNSAHLVAPGENLSPPYRKRLLLPFGEYMPLRDLMTWPSWVAPDVTDMTPGNEAQLFKLPNSIQLGTLICWENLFAHLARESVANGAQILVQLTNDVWFGNTAAPHQHNLMSIMRAVENRVPVVIVSNTGPSQIIDAYGRVVAVVPIAFTEGIATTDIQVGLGNSVSTAAGDMFALAVIGFLVTSAGWRIAAVLLGAHRRVSLTPAREWERTPD